jgi:hypothetical protein
MVSRDRADSCLLHGGNAIYLKAAVDCDANSRGATVLYLTMGCGARQATREQMPR